MKRVDKVLGGDMELGNVLQTRRPGQSGNDQAASLLLAEISGIPARRHRGAYLPYYILGASDGDTGSNPQDAGRRYLDTNGGCFYIDLGHLEACIPEVRSASNFVAAHHANFRIARDACRRANQKLGQGERLIVLANNSDRLGNSWGGHLNVLVSRDLWDETFNRMLPTLFELAAFQVSSIIYTGQGKVGAENGKPEVAFQLTQRGDFFECLAAPQTTYRRPICNTRDEGHVGCGAESSELARMHIIFFDTTLTHGSNYLRAGVMQLILAMFEFGWSDESILLRDPLAALTHWGHDPQLTALAELYDGRLVTAVEHQRIFAEAARKFVEAGEAHFVPEAERILAFWEDTLDKLDRRDFIRLAPRLDWVMKHALLTRMLDGDPRLDWRSPEIRAADLLFADLDEGEGLYSVIEAHGGTESIATEAEIARAMREPPCDTRAWTRTMLLREYGDHIENVNWDEVGLTGGRSIKLADPRRFGRDDLSVSV